MRLQPSEPARIAIVGGGPAGLMAAEVLSAAGWAVTVYERMPTVGRKFLMAGRGGLNLTHAEPFDRFVTRYAGPADRLRPILEAFPPEALRAWAEGLGQETFVGSSGRVFPRAMKASPLLRAWLARLQAQGVQIRTRHEWQGWTAGGDIRFATPQGEVIGPPPDRLVLALGGASWPGLGADGAWAPLLASQGVALSPFKPSNCGFTVQWSGVFATRFAGAPLKNIALGFDGHTVRGEAMITSWGLEGGAVYALSARLRDRIEAEGSACLACDLRPDLSLDRLRERLKAPRRGQSATSFLRKAAGLDPAAIGLLREAHGVELPTDAGELGAAIRCVPVRLTGTQGLARAISSAGGVRLTEVDEALMLSRCPGVYLAGEMLDWEAPTGGYLLQACFAMAVAVAQAIGRP